MIKRVSESYKKHYPSFVFGPLIKLIEAVFDLLIPLFMKAIIDLNQYGSPDLIPNAISKALANFIRLFGVWVPTNQNLNDAIIGGVIILVMAILGFVITMTAQYVAARVAVNVGSDLRLSLYKKILSFSKKDKERFGNSYLQSVLNNDVYQVERAALIFVRLIARAPFIILGSIVFTFILEPKIGIPFAIIVPILAFALFIILRNSSRKYTSIQKNLDQISNKTSDTITGARVIRAFGAEQYEKNKFNSMNEEYEKNNIKVQRNNALLNPLIFEITSVVTILVVFIIYLLSVDADESLRVVLSSTAIAAMAYLVQIFFATIQLANVLLDLTRGRVSRQRIDEVLGQKTTIENVEKPLTSGPKRQLLSFNHVSFSFDEEDKHYALKDISFVLNKGETLGIIGGTGSGKSTIISLIERFIDPTKGDIKYNETSLKDYDLSSLRNDIGLVNQKSSLFNGTIKDNFLMAKKDASTEEIDEALKKAEAYDFVYKFDNNIEKEIKEGGTNVSGGQRQRLCIARALIKNPKLLILDDSTSALDLLTDKKIRTTLKKMNDMTKIIVSQRVSSISSADKILVIDQGQVVGYDTHENLLNTCKIYQEIASTQANME